MSTRSLSVASLGATWKTSESPYMGRVKLWAIIPMLPMGPLPEESLLGWPTRTLSLSPLPRARRAITEERLGAVVVAAGDGVVVALGSVGAVGAGLVLVVGLVVPGPVVEILVVVGGFGAAQPVDGHSLVGIGVGAAGVVAGIDGRGAADHPESRAVGPDVSVAGGGEVLNEGVVVRDVGGRSVALGGGEEQQPGTGRQRRARRGSVSMCRGPGQGES